MAEQDVFDLVVLEGKVFDVIGVNDAKIAQAAKQFMPLTIKDMDDKAGYAAVHEGRMVVKGMRVMVEKHAKKVREKAVKFQKDVIVEEKRVVGLIQPIEDHLADEENRVEEEKARIRAEAEAKILAILQARENRLLDMGCRFDRITEAYQYGTLVAPVALLKVASDEQFETFYTSIQEVIDKENAEKAVEEKRRFEEQALILKVQAEQEAERQRQAKERERLAAEAKTIQDEKDRLIREAKAAEDAKIAAEQEKERAAEMEKAKAEAAEKAAKETEERIRRAAVEKEAKEKAEAEEKTRKEEAARIRAEKKEARRPDKEKLVFFLDRHFGQIAELQLKTDEGRSACEAIFAIIQTAEKDCREIVEKL